MNEKMILTLFTLLAQMGVGLWAVHGLQDSKDGTALWLVVGFVGCSMVLSMLHLGTPAGAHRAILGIRRSWLSREIFFLGGFFGVAVLRLILRLAEVGPGMDGALFWTGLAAGGFCIFCMAMIYVKTAFAAWQTVYTPVTFFTAALLLGGGVSILTDGGGKETVWWMSGLVLLQWLSAMLYVVQLGKGDSFQRASLRSAGLDGKKLALAMALTALGCVGMTHGADCSFALYGGALFLTVGQGINRYVFYAGGVHPMNGRF